MDAIRRPAESAVAHRDIVDDAPERRQQEGLAIGGQPVGLGGQAWKGRMGDDPTDRDRHEIGFIDIDGHARAPSEK